MSEEPPPRNTKWPHQRTPTVQDLALRRCFICLDEDRSRDNSEGFVHACNCTLVAHDRCLLEWTASSPSGDADRSKCAQCGARYAIVVRTPLALRILDVAEAIGRRAGGVILLGSAACVAVGIAGSAYAAGVTYGCYAARWMLGRRLYMHSLAIHPSRWSPAVWFMMPAVPLAFLWASSGARLGWLPTTTIHSLAIALASPAPVRPLLASALTGVSALRIFGRALARVFADWPPSPFFLSLLFPFVRILYVRYLARFQPARLPPAAAGRQPAPAREPGQPRQLFVNVLRGADADLHVQVADREEAGGMDERKGVAIGRTIAGMLLLPPLAGSVGQLLARIPWRWVRAFLSVGDPPGERVGGWADFEPVWWHSLVGLALITVVRDALAISHERLKVSERDSRYVVDKPFTGVDLEALDLVNDSS